MTASKLKEYLDVLHSSNVMSFAMRVVENGVTSEFSVTFGMDIPENIPSGPGGWKEPNTVMQRLDDVDKLFAPEEHNL